MLAITSSAASRPTIRATTRLLVQHHLGAALPAVAAAGRAQAKQQQRQHSLLICADAVASAAATPGDSSGQSKDNRPASLSWVAAGLVVAAVGGGGCWAVTSTAAAPLLVVLKHYLASSVLAKSGFFAAFSLIFLSELGDKTFFIAALLAMRCGKWVSFVGSTVALAAMTIISVGIGFAVKRVPTVVESSEVLGQWAGAGLLVYFGLRTLRDVWEKTEEAADDELADAEEEVKSAEQGGKIHGRQAPVKALLEVASLIFVAEWGDRSMLATIALGAAQSPLGVAGGAILAHTATTFLAVLGGAVLSRHISEKKVAFASGMLFLLCGVGTAFGIL